MITMQHCISEAPLKTEFAKCFDKQAKTGNSEDNIKKTLYSQTTKTQYKSLQVKGIKAIKQPISQKRQRKSDDKTI